jgi:hypothetical protein
LDDRRDRFPEMRWWLAFAAVATAVAIGMYLL